MNATHLGPREPLSQSTHASKYRLPGEDFLSAIQRVASVLSDNDEHEAALINITAHQRFLFGGRIQSAIGAPRAVTPYNCFVSPTIHDSFDGIMEAAVKGGRTMRMGGGDGYDFSTLRPRGDIISSLGSQSSGPVAWMGVFDGVCGAICSAGHRRGAQMGMLRVDHPDILEFVEAKTNTHKLTNFNLSVAITDEFMTAVINDTGFDLRFEDRFYERVSARHLWDRIMLATWDWAEPGVIFIDRINEMNNLWYCETIAATNPCGEQPLPPNGACLLGSINLVRYVSDEPIGRTFNFKQLKADIPHIVRALDNVIDVALYPLPEQREEAISKRRMGIGVTGLANALEALGLPYASEGFLEMEAIILGTIRDESYRASALLAEEKGPFPLYDPKLYPAGKFIHTLPQDVFELIVKHGIRNSHLTSVAPTGTISLTADNISSGIEPVFDATPYDRTVITEDGPVVSRIEDYGVKYFGVIPKTAGELTINEHLDVLLVAQHYTDSAVSKTCNVGNNVTFEEFSNLYLEAYKGGAKGCTTFRAAGKRMGILVAANDARGGPEAPPVIAGTACYINPETGQKECA